MRTRRRLLWLGLGTALVAVAAALADAPIVIRLLFGLPVVLLIPGYGLAEAIDPWGRLRGTERLTIALAGSVCIAAVAGLLIAGSPAGLGTVSWSAGLGWISVLLTLLGLHRTRHHLQQDATLRVAERRTGMAAAAIFLLMVGASLAIVIAAETLGSERNVERGESEVLQLWATPAGGGQLTVGFENPTDTAIACTLRVRQGPVLVREEELLLSPGSETLTVTPSAEGSVLFPLEVVLLDESGATVLRRVSVWMHLADRPLTDVNGAKG